MPASTAAVNQHHHSSEVARRSGSVSRTNLFARTKPHNNRGKSAGIYQSRSLVTIMVIHVVCWEALQYPCILSNVSGLCHMLCLIMAQKPMNVQVLFCHSACLPDCAGQRLLPCMYICSRQQFAFCYTYSKCLHEAANVLPWTSFTTTALHHTANATQHACICRTTQSLLSALEADTCCCSNTAADRLSIYSHPME